MEGSGEWSTFVEGIVKPPFFQTEIFPFSPYTTYQKVCQVSTIWTKPSQILISKCYNSVQICGKMITKSYKTYGKYLKIPGKNLFGS